MKGGDTSKGPDSALARCKEQLVGDLAGGEEPTFAEPWQAQAFALAVHLIDSGQISWSEWSAALGEEIVNAPGNGIRDDGSEYYLLWLRTLERLVSDKSLVSEGELQTLAEDWKQAYLTTPHGLPVSLPGD